jgi:hypothetical protein
MSSRDPPSPPDFFLETGTKIALNCGRPQVFEIRLILRSSNHDPEIEIWSVPAVFPEEKPKDRQAEKSGNLRHS